MNKKSPTRSIRESKNPPNAVTLLYLRAIMPSIVSNKIPANAMKAIRYHLLITATKNKRGGILPMRVRTFGLTSERCPARGSKYFSIWGFLLLSIMKKHYKIDLHTHSIISYDGGMTKKHYMQLLNNGILDFIAITDHNQINFARILHNEIGEKIIIGEEIKTTEGEIIGLFLKKNIAGGQTAKQTVDQIHEQGGLVYVPHPLEHARSGLHQSTLETIIEDVDILETFNARGGLRGRPKEVEDLAISAQIARAASSDAHCYSGAGTAYSIVTKFPGNNSLVKLLKQGTTRKEYAPWYSYFCPGFNKIKNKLVLGI